MRKYLCSVVLEIKEFFSCSKPNPCLLLVIKYIARPCGCKSFHAAKKKYNCQHLVTIEICGKR